jgi:hypothetical protein
MNMHKSPYSQMALTDSGLHAVKGADALLGARKDEGSRYSPMGVNGLLASAEVRPGVAYAARNR